MFKMLQEFAGGVQSVRDKLNELVRAVNSLMQIRGDETFISVNHAQGTSGLTIGLNINQVLARIPKQYRNTIFLVALTKDGGADGTQTTAATWTYTAKSEDGSITYGTALTPKKSRPNGKATQAPFGYMDQKPSDGTYRLLEAWELYGTAGCS